MSLLELRDWLVNAFNGEWLRTDDPQPAPYHVVPA
jgi:dipeptidyl aminopeptidase